MASRLKKDCIGIERLASSVAIGSVSRLAARTNASRLQYRVSTRFLRPFAPTPSPRQPNRILDPAIPIYYPTAPLFIPVLVKVDLTECRTMQHSKAFSTRTANGLKQYPNMIPRFSKRVQRAKSQRCSGSAVPILECPRVL